MIAAIGTIAVWGALISAGLALMACVVGAWSGRGGLIGLVKSGLTTTAVLMLVALAALAGAMVLPDLRLSYVSSHVEYALSHPLRLAALWSGQEGSLLLWSTLTAVVAAAVAIRTRRLTGSGGWVTLAAVALTQTFLGGMLVFAASPFALASEAVSDGLGLHPQLQHWSMIIHPPLILLSYALLLAPFALACGAMADRDGGREWADALWPWVTAAWTCLGLGMLIGAWWAYVELGWGGYWAWDPVENASLMPWLTTTALLHTLGLHRRRGRLVRWTALLAVATYALCILGAFLTRSGVVQSVHAFARSSVGEYLLGLLSMVVLMGGGLHVLRGRQMSDAATESASLAGTGAEAARTAIMVRLTLVANAVLLLMVAGVLLGTLFPVVSGWVLTTPAGMSSTYFNRMVAPLGLVLVALMAASAVVPDLLTQPGQLRRKLILPALAGAGAAGLAIGSGHAHGLLVLCVGLGVFALGVLVLDLATTIHTFSHQTGFGLGLSTVMVLERQRRQTASRLAHAGVAILLIGVAGSSLMTRTADATLVVGETVSSGGFEIRLDSLREVRADTYTAVEADLKVAAGGGVWRSFSPQRRYYDKFADPVSEVAIQSGPRTDLYVAMLGWNGRDQRISVQVHENPLALWVWVGGGLMVLAGPVSMLPRWRIGARTSGEGWSVTDVDAASSTPKRPSRQASKP